jgi:hypothetical protein
MMTVDTEKKAAEVEKAAEGGLFGIAIGGSSLVLIIAFGANTPVVWCIAPFAIGACVFYGVREYLKYAPQIPTRKRDEKLAKAKCDAQIVCLHCQTRGFVTTEKVQVKKGIHGGKATAALLTGGATMLATGLSQHDQMTQATCSNCGSTWRF